MAKSTSKTTKAIEYETIELGDRVQEPMTGFTGIATCIAFWLQGCVRVIVQPEGLTKDGDMKLERVFDAGLLEVVKKGVKPPVMLVPTFAPPATDPGTGGPAREPAGFRR